MIAYRPDERLRDTHRELDALIQQAGAASPSIPDGVLALFIEAGEFEAAVADRLFPDRDGLHPSAEALRRGALAAAHAMIASWKGEPDRTRAALECLRRELRGLRGERLPSSIARRVSEGYAYYA